MGVGKHLPIRGFNGQYDVSVLGDGRVRLPNEVVKQLGPQGGKWVWLATLPDLKALVICPERFWPDWVQWTTKRFTFLETEDGIRALRSTWVRRQWDRKNRILIPDTLMQYAAITIHGRVVLVAFKTHFELWDESSFKEHVAKWKEERPKGKEGGP